MRKYKNLIICVLCIVCIGTVLLLVSFHKEYSESYDAKTFIYNSEKSAIIDGTQKTFDEWKQITLDQDEAKQAWSASERNVAAQYSVEGIQYYLIYMDYSGKKADYLDFFLAEVKNKNGKFSFTRVSSFYGLVPENEKEKTNNKSEIISGQTAKGETVVPLYFTCVKAKGKDRIFIDDRSVQNCEKKSKTLDAKVFGIIDVKQHNIDIL